LENHEFKLEKSLVTPDRAFLGKVLYGGKLIDYCGKKQLIGM